MQMQRMSAWSAPNAATDSFDRLIAKWKRPGYEKLCCVRCIQARVRWKRTLLIE